MADGCKTKDGIGRTVDCDVEASPSAVEMEKKADPAPPPRPTKTLAEAEEGTAVTKELCHTVKNQENMEFGAGIAGSGVSLMVAWYFLFPEDRGAHNLHYVIPLLLAFTCFISGVSLMMLSMNLLQLPEHLVSEFQRMASKFLSLLCSTLPVVTLVSPLVLSGYKVYRYIGLVLLVIVTAPLAVVRWYVGHKAEGGNQEAAYKEHGEQLEAAFKLISSISNYASSSLVALVVNFDVNDGSGQTKSAVLVAIFFSFTAAIWGLLSMEIRAKVLEINSQRTRGFVIQSMWLAIIFMHLWLACAVLAEVFATVGFCIFAAFAPLVFPALVYIFLEHCVRHAGAAQDNNANENQKVQLKWKAERGIKIAMWSFSLIIGIFGGFLHGHEKVEYLEACIILLTSAFLSGFALMVLTIRPDSTSAGLAAATTVLDLTAGATFGAAIFAVIIAMVLQIM